MRMIPSILAPSTRSSAEKRIFAALQELVLPDEYACLHSVDLPEHHYKVSGELDFVIVSSRGLYVLEVKGGNVACQNGLWLFTNRYGEVSTKVESPFAQAESGMYALRERLLRIIPARELSRMVMGYGVVFPDIAWDVEGVTWPAEVVLDARRWRSYGLLHYLKALETYWHAKLPHAPARADPAFAKRIVSAIRPDFELARSLQVEADQLEARMLRLTEEQYQRLDLMEDCPRLLIAGGAGTGKTFLAVEMARRHAAAGKKVLLVCFSPVLGTFLRQQVQQRGIQVAAVHELMLHIVSKHGTLPADYSADLLPADSWFALKLGPACIAAAASIPDDERFDVLIIDEAQDILNLDYLTALGSLVRGGLEAGVWRIFYDEFNQGAIYGAMDLDVIDLLKEYATVAPRLKTNCRNTNEVVLQTRLMTGADLGVESTGPGPTVRFKTYSTPEQAIELLEKYLDEQVDRDVPGRSITILSPLPYEQSSASLLSNRWRRQLTVIHDPAGLTFPFSGLTFATVADFKGLENAFVALIDIDDLSSTQETLATVYVGMSRARVGLWIAMHTRVIAQQVAMVENYASNVSRGLIHD